MRGALNEMDRHDGDRVLAENRLKHEAARMSKVSSWPINPCSQVLNRAESWKRHADSREIFDRARATMLLWLMASFTESDTLGKQLALEKTTKKVEMERLEHLGAQTQPSPRSPHLPSGPVKNISDTRAVANDNATWTTAVDQDDDQVNGAPFAEKLALCDPDLLIKPTHRQDQIRRYPPAQPHKKSPMRFYVSDDVESDVRRCIRSWEHQHSISVTGRTVAGEMKCFSGTVEAVVRAPSLATGGLWLVTMRN